MGLLQAAVFVISAQAPHRTHQHPQSSNVLPRVAREVSILPLNASVEGTRENVVVSRSRRYMAFTTSSESERIFVENRRW